MAQSFMQRAKAAAQKGANMLSQEAEKLAT